jgi:hypothetical protein
MMKVQQLSSPKIPMGGERLEAEAIGISRKLIQMAAYYLFCDILTRPNRLPGVHEEKRETPSHWNPLA